MDDWRDRQLQYATLYQRFAASYAASARHNLECASITRYDRRKSASYRRSAVRYQHKAAECAAKARNQFAFALSIGAR